MKLDKIKEMTAQVGGELKPNTKNVDYGGIGGDDKNNAWVESIYYENDVLMIKFQVSVRDKNWSSKWAYCTDTAENFFNSVDGYENEVEGTKFNYSIDDIDRCIEHCKYYCEWYDYWVVNKGNHIVSFD